MQEDNTNEIADVFAEYADGMNDFDAEAITDLFIYPATIWQMGKAHVFDEAADLRENVEKLLAMFDQAGITYSSAEIGPVHVSTAGAFAHIQWCQEDASNAIIHRFCCDYTLVETRQGWKIITILNEEALDEEGGLDDLEG